jgi:hypothetical protein
MNQNEFWATQAPTTEPEMPPTELALTCRQRCND